MISKKVAEKIKKDQKMRFIFQIFMVAIAGIIGGFSFCSFFQPAQIIPTGLSGLAQIIHNLFYSQLIDIPTSVIYLIINVVLFLISLRLFGWKFLVLTFVGLATYTLAMEFFSIPVLVAQADDVLLYSIIGGFLYGFGVGLAYRYGGSTGGSDILAMVINKFFPKLKRGGCILFINIGMMNTLKVSINFCVIYRVICEKIFIFFSAMKRIIFMKCHCSVLLIDYQ